MVLAVQEVEVEVAAYCRISRDRPDDELGVTRQLNDCKALVAARNWHLFDAYIDNDAGAWDEKRKKRPQYDRMIEDVKAGRIHKIVVWHTDRLHRSMRELEDLIDLVETTPVQIVTVTSGDIDLNTSEGRSFARMMCAIARKESDDKSRRIRRKHLEIAEAGRSKGGVRHFGYEYIANPNGESDKRGVLRIRESEAKLIREAAKRYLAGESVGAICRDWTSRSIPTVRGAKKWSPETLRRILTSATVAGLREYKGEVIGSASWQAILDQPTWQRLNTLIRDPKRALGVRRPRTYLLTGGISRCALCGSRLSALKKQGGVKTYVCSSAVDKSGCGGISCRAELLDRWVVDSLLAAIDSKDLALVTSKVSGDNDAGVQDDLRALEARKTELAEMYASGEIDRADWSDARQPIQAAIDRAHQLLARETKTLALSPFMKKGVDLEELWSGMSLGQRQAVVSAAIAEVRVHKPSRRGRTFDAGRVEIIWRA